GLGGGEVGIGSWGASRSCASCDETAGLLLRGEIIERAAIAPADHLGAFERAEDFVAALLLEDLRVRLELGHVLGPFPLGPAEAFFGLLVEPFELEVVLREVVDRPVALRL